jgi:hypothetical protein
MEDLNANASKKAAACAVDLVSSRCSAYATDCWRSQDQEGQNWLETSASHREAAIAPGRPAGSSTQYAAFLPAWCTSAPDRVAPARLFGSCPHLRRAAFARGSLAICWLLQRDAHAFGAGQGYAATTSHPTIWDHRHHTHLVRIASSLQCPCRHWPYSRCKVGAIGIEPTTSPA